MKTYSNNAHIIIKGLETEACHGVNPEEKRIPQKWVIDIDMAVDISKASETDDLTKTINYASVSKFVVAFFHDNCFDLIETLADRLCQALIVHYGLIKKVKVEVKKPNAPMNQTFEYVSVKAKREWVKCYIALGSNLEDRGEHLDNAVEALQNTKNIKFIKESRRLNTKPYGGVADQEFLNSCAEIETCLTPRELLNVLHDIENKEGRTREVHWGNRTLDLDIIYYGDYVVQEEDLVIPHMDMQNRIFVLDPLCKLCPKKVHPLYGLTTEQMLNKLLNF